MVAPLIAVPFLVGSSVGGLYSVGKGIENKRFWRDYARNTHRSPRYPFRAGRYDYIRDFGMSMNATGFVFKNAKKFR